MPTGIVNMQQMLDDMVEIAALLGIPMIIDVTPPRRPSLWGRFWDWVSSGE